MLLVLSSVVNGAQSERTEFAGTETREFYLMIPATLVWCISLRGKYDSDFCSLDIWNIIKNAINTQ